MGIYQHYAEVCTQSYKYYSYTKVKHVTFLKIGEFMEL